jgi:Rieske 2Fe-2S family protein
VSRAPFLVALRYDPLTPQETHDLAPDVPATPRRPAPIAPEEIARIRAPFRKATLLPARAYHDQAVYDWEVEEIFLRDWIAVGRAEEVPEPTSFTLRDVLGENVIVVRGRDNRIRAFYNVCRHRGTAVEERECGKAVRFQCPYHAWIYDLDGSLIRAKHTEDLEDFSFDTFGLTEIRCETWGGFVFLCFAGEDVTPSLQHYLGDWFDHHAGFGRDMSTLRRAARLTYDVGANWKIVAENYSECYHCPPVHKMLNRLTPYDLGEDFLAEGPWKGGWMPFAEGCETMSISGTRDGRPLLYARDETEERRIYYYILWPNLIVSVHPDYVLTHQAWPDGPNRSTVHCDLYVEADVIDTIDVSGAVEFWDITNHEDYHVVEMQQQGTRSRSWTAGRYSNQEASVHAFDIMVADRYANDGSRTVRGWRTETASDRRLVTRILGPAQQAETAEAERTEAE